jgi:hypothetical protein
VEPVDDPASAAPGFRRTHRVSGSPVRPGSIWPPSLDEDRAASNSFLPRHEFVVLEGASRPAWMLSFRPARIAQFSPGVDKDPAPRSDGRAECRRRVVDAHKSPITIPHVGQLGRHRRGHCESGDSDRQLATFIPCSEPPLGREPADRHWNVAIGPAWEPATHRGCGHRGRVRPASA